MLGRQPRVLCRAEDPARTLQVVVDEPRVRETREHLATEHPELVVVQGAPRRKGELEQVEAALDRPLDPLDQDPRRQADQTDHRVGVRARHLFAEEPADLIELPLRDGVALAGRPEDVQVLDSGPQMVADLLAEHVLQNVAVLGPRDADAGEDDAREARFGGGGARCHELPSRGDRTQAAGLDFPWSARLWPGGRASRRALGRCLGRSLRCRAPGSLPEAHRIAQPVDEVGRERRPNEDRELVGRAALEDHVDAREQRLGTGAHRERPRMQVDRTAVGQDLCRAGTCQAKDRPMGGHVHDRPARLDEPPPRPRPR